MSPLLPGVIASGISGNLTPADTGAYFPLQVITVGSAGASSITFSNIPSTYTHLQLRAMASCPNMDASYLLTFNSDNITSNYYSHRVGALGTGTYVGQSAASNRLNGGLGSTVGGLILDILDYANTNKYKTCRSIAGYDSNSTDSEIWLGSMLWMNTNAITSLTLSGNNGNFQQYNSFALYGIKGA